MDVNMYQRKYYKPKRPIKGRSSTLDINCLESTPESMRIEIDNIFKEFVGDPNTKEYVFPHNLNNLQRKYIHYMAQKMNFVSKSYGKEPYRQLHIKKKVQQLANQSFVITPSPASQEHLAVLKHARMPTKDNLYMTQSSHSLHKVAGKLVHSPAVVPTYTNGTEDMQIMRENLPVFPHREEIINTIYNNTVTVISSETGSGKTTQIPQYIIDDAALHNRPCKIICTQPRRISTVAAAERVSHERGDVLGASVGYHIKLEHKYSINTNIIFCTTGVFLRNLMFGDDALNNITHIIIDEIHERDKLSDFLLIYIKQNLALHPHLRIILMSATINTKKFEEYFENVRVLLLPGRLFEIETKFLEDILEKTKYMSSKMKQMQCKENGKFKESTTIDVFDIETVRQNNAVNPCVDEALDDYLNFTENYDYRLHYEEATAQLSMLFVSEHIPVDYKHSVTGQTALMIAAHLGDKSFASKLCCLGAQLDLQCKYNKTVFDYAGENEEILRLLEYVNDKKHLDSNSTADEGPYLLSLYDKTTPDDVIDYDLIVHLTSFIHTSDKEGSILVFLPGYDEIMICNDYIVNSAMNANSYRIFFLHGSMNIKDQSGVFKRLENRRKIILSTNIAETSITIDDVVFVIDVGKAKIKNYDSYNKLSSLQTHWISQACANQRKGRAGRTRPGMCCRLYSKQRFDNMDQETLPEILRVSLEELCIHAKVLAPNEMNISDFLSLAPDAPSANSINVAVEHLQFLGALDEDQNLTRLGAFLSQLTIEPQLGKMLLYGVMFRCLEPVLTLVASHQDPFQLPPQANLKTLAAERRKSLTHGFMSDHLLYIKVFKKWQESCAAGNSAQFCREYFISHSSMNLILETRNQLLGQLRAIKFINQSNNLDEYNKNANCWPLFKAIICTGLYPNLAYPSNNNLTTRQGKKVNIQSSSACANQAVTTWLVYDEMIMHRNGLLIRGVTAVTTLTIGLFCGIETNEQSSNSVNIDNWLEFEYPDHLVNVLRSAIDTLVYKILIHPWHNFEKHDDIAVKTLINVLEAEEDHAQLNRPLKIGTKPIFFLPQKTMQRSINNSGNSNERQSHHKGQSYRNRNGSQSSSTQASHSRYRNSHNTSYSRNQTSYRSHPSTSQAHPRQYPHRQNEYQPTTSQANHRRYHNGPREENYFWPQFDYNSDRSQNSVYPTAHPMTRGLRHSVQNMHIASPSWADQLLNGLRND